MQRNIVFEKGTFTYTVRKTKRAKRISLTVHADGRIVVSGPHSITERSVERFVKQKQAWIVKQVAHFQSIKKVVLPLEGNHDYKSKKEEARKFVTDRIAQFTKFYNVPIRGIRIKNQKTRWGSCSEDRNLNFNYKLIFLPIEIADYIIVHELCHLKELNHSKKFWDLVALAVPEHKRIRKELRNFNVSLS